MTKIKGTNVSAPVVPFDTTDVQPSHEAKYGRGGYRTAATTAERDAIPTARREAGMLVFVEADGKVYKLAGDLATWAEFTPTPGTHQHVAADITDFTTAVVAAAPPTTNASLLTSGTLPDQRLSSNIARTSDVSSAVAALVNSSPSTLDTLSEIAAAIANDGSFATTVTNALAAKAPINNPTFTGTVGGVTKSMVGLGNVDNTSDANKPVSTAMQTALADKAAATHASQHATGGSDALSPSDIGAAAAADFDQSLKTADGVQFVSAQLSGSGGPVRKFLQVGGKFTVESSFGAWGQFQIVNPDDGEVTLVLASSGALEEDGTITAPDGDHVWAIGIGAFARPSTDFVIGNNTSGAVLCIPPSGSVGIGTTEPTATLHVVGGVRIADVDDPSKALEFDVASIATGQTRTLTAPNASGTIALTSQLFSGSYDDLSNKPTIPSAYTLPTASATVLGGVKVGSGLSIDGSSVLSATYSYTLPAATTSTLGGVIVGSGLSVSSGTVSANVTSVAGRTGAVTIAAADVSGLGSLATQSSVAYSSLTGIPSTFAPVIATASVVGGVKQGSNVTIAGDGTISVAAPVTSLPYSSITGTPSTLPPTAGSVTDSTITSGGLSASAISWTAIAAWQPSTAYAKGDLVEYLGVAYRRSAAGTSGATFNTSNWQQVTPSEFVGSQITSGTVPIARLGTGTPSASNYLRGDGSFAAAPVTSVDGNTGAVTISKATIYEFTRSSKPSDATGSNGSYTWSLPAGAKLVEFFMIGGGGGGGSGRKGAGGTARYGGGGGSSAGVVHTTVMASLITTSLTITVGAGGGGGSAQTANDTNGNAGSIGNATSIVFNSSATNVLNAEYGQGGGGGTATAGSGANLVSNRVSTFRGNNGQAANVTNLSNIPEGIAVSGNVALPGAAGGSMDGASVIYTPGAVVLPSTFFAVSTQIGSNGGGGAASSTGNAGSGSNGAGYGYGGCGGGAAANNNGNSGAGGNGGDGYVRITVWF